jgi:hypothetical protein
MLVRFDSPVARASGVRAVSTTKVPFGATSSSVDSPSRPDANQIVDAATARTTTAPTKARRHEIPTGLRANMTSLDPFARSV